MQIAQREVNMMHVAAVVGDWCFVHVKNRDQDMSVCPQFLLLPFPPVRSPQLRINSLSIDIADFFNVIEYSVLTMIAIIEQVFRDMFEIISDASRISPWRYHLDVKS